MTIYVGPGDYYLFNCFKKFTEDYACIIQNYEWNGSLEVAQNWCSYLPDLPQRMYNYDNVDFFFKPLCLYKSEYL